MRGRCSGLAEAVLFGTPIENVDESTPIPDPRDLRFPGGDNRRVVCSNFVMICSLCSLSQLLHHQARG